MKVAGGTVSVSHLPFVDDFLFICESIVHKILVIKSVLRNLELTLGLIINFHKSKLGAWE